MIKRLSKHNDLKDLIKSCPSGVIDDIYAIEYYIQGHNETIQGTFTKKETMLEVILPSVDLETLPNGILMRRAYYKVVDTSYPDGYYNLEFEDNMNIWLGGEESEEPIIPEYVTEEELAETLGDYATQEWVENKGYITTSALSGYATESWVQSQGYLTSHQDLSSYATKSWVSSQQFATESWVSSQGYLTSHQDLSSYATEQWVGDQGYLTSTDLNDYVTQTWVENQGYYAPDVAHNPVEYHNLLNDPEIEIEYQDYNPKTMRLIEPGEDGFVIGQISVLDGDPTLEYVDKIQGVYFGKNARGSYTVGLYQYAVTDKNGSIIYPESFYEFATSNQLNSYATQKWVNNKGYATQSWATNQFLEESKVWTGTETQWNQLTEEQKASYTIALITQ